MSNNIAQLNKHLQVAKESDFSMQGIAFKKLIRNIIVENATTTKDGFKLYVDELNSTDKRLLLSYLVSAEEFEFLTENQTRLESAFVEYYNTMQSIIDDRIDEVYSEAMEEMGIVFSRRSNGDIWPMKKYY